MMVSAASHRRTPSEQNALSATAEEPAGETAFVTLEKHTSEMEADGIAIEAPNNTSKSFPEASSAAEEGKLAAIQRERAQQPAKALTAIVASGVSTKKGTPSGKDGTVGLPAKAASASWFGWGKAKGSKALDESEDDQVRRGGSMGTAADESVEDHMRKDGKVGNEPMDPDDVQRSQLEEAIERNQAEQDALRKQLNCKQAELVGLLEQHSNLLRKAAEASVDTAGSPAAVELS